MSAPVTPLRTRAEAPAPGGAAASVPRAPRVDALPTRRWILDLTAAGLLLLLPVVGFAPTFDGASYLVAALGGLVLGMGLGVLGRLFRWGILLLTAATIVVYFLFGGALALPHTTVAGVIPTLETLRRLALGAVMSWKELLTTIAPVATDDGHLIVPFILSLLAAVLTTSLALRLQSAGWALLPAAAFLAIQIALGTSEPFAPVVQGIAFGLVAVVWLAVRQAWQPQAAAISVGEGTARSGSGMRRVLMGAAVVAIAAVVGVATSGFAAPSSPRYVLRDVVIPPFDIREFASPLQSFRAYVRDHPDDPLFTVSGLPEGARVRLATMDAYNGTVYNVSDDGTGSSSAFAPARTNMSADAEGTPATVHVEIGELESVWMPDAGAVQSVTFDGARADDLRRTAHYNEATDTGVVTLGLEKGDEYTLEAVIPEVPSDEALADQDFAPLRMPKQVGVPESLADIASKTVADAETPVEQVRALQQMLSEGGFFSHGLAGQPLSRAGHGAERIATLLGSEQMVGDDEQYATAMALLAAQVGIPARVVMGFYPDEDAAAEPVYTATGETLHAWVEVAFDGAGWVPFDPTPPEDQVPSDQTTKPKADPKPQVLQPPPPPTEPVDLPPTVADDRGSEDENAFDAGLLWTIVSIGVGALGLLAVLLAPFIVIGALKAARRRKRREAERASDRISGGWDELVDRASDFGAPVRPGATRQEDAGVLAAAFAEPRVATLATRADREVFGPTDPSPDDIEAFWTQVDEIVGGMGKGRSVWQRLGARLSIRTLLEGTRFALPARPAPRARTTQPISAPPPGGDAAKSPTRRSRRGSKTRSAPEPSTHPAQENE
ncbi:transglutaminase domain-containing protein [Microbacterium trichothecenolyticum]|uniref:transglutaminase-like domain-containing protein n=1 Tax=Microbacterium trichothecenolyticum TaxID=69370 RepID=UPI001C6EB611|nr:transglutaminase-like domain-containing protein [Microbacterium trichothecenolyticum]MBW9121160.1 transglutaminase domain-containing protein [Microbacterium trichothecenolyticum]